MVLLFSSVLSGKNCLSWYESCFRSAPGAALVVRVADRAEEPLCFWSLRFGPPILSEKCVFGDLLFPWGVPVR